MIPTVYVYAESKAELNRRLEVDQTISGTEYQQLQERTVTLRALPTGTVVKMFTKVIAGSPFAKAYGNIAFKPDGSVYVK